MTRISRFTLILCAVGLATPVAAEPWARNPRASGAVTQTAEAPAPWAGNPRAGGVTLQAEATIPAAPRILKPKAGGTMLLLVEALPDEGSEIVTRRRGGHTMHPETPAAATGAEIPAPIAEADADTGIPLPAVPATMPGGAPRGASSR